MAGELREAQVAALLKAHAEYEAACQIADKKAMKNCLVVFNYAYKKSTNAEQGEFHHRFCDARKGGAGQKSDGRATLNSHSKEQISDHTLAAP